MPEIVIISKWLTVNEPSFAEFTEVMLARAVEMAKCDEKYDGTNPGVVYFRQRNLRGKRTGKAMSLLDSQTSLASACMEAHRYDNSPGRRVLCR